jgi:predicted alpha/beta superfamily hydrolase
MKSATVCIKKLRVTASIFLLAFLLDSCTKEAFTYSEIKEFTLRSAVNGATYEIKVGLAGNYNPAEKYATIYVLDGKEIFGFVSNRCKEISDLFPSIVILK